MSSKIIKILVFVCVAACFAAWRVGAGTVVELVRVIDGDTFVFNLDGLPVGRKVLSGEFTVRLAGVDTPEMRGRCESETARALAAKRFASGMLNAATVIEVARPRIGKSGIVAEVRIDGLSLASLIIKSGHGRTYTGGRRKGWC